jgi:hypothetical protein
VIETFDRERWALGLQFSSQKGVDFCGERSVTAAVPRQGLWWILPRWRLCHCGASVVTAHGDVATKKDPPNVAQQNHHKGQDCARQEPREKACEASKKRLGPDSIGGQSKSLRIN